MMKLLVIADDLTGAMDTGVQFSAKGIRTLVTMDLETFSACVDEFASVLVVDTESRHLSGASAYERVHRIVLAAKNSGIAFVLKKTDSTLRGNIGSELQAVMDAWDTSDLMFLPAYPANGRTTEKGRQYVHGMPLELTPFAHDSLEPMTDSDIRHIIGRQCAYASVSVPVDEFRATETESCLADDGPGLVDSGTGLADGECKTSTGDQNRKTIHIFDSRTQDELLQAVQWLDSRHLLHVTAGCAGLASILADTLVLDDRSECPESDDRSECSGTKPGSARPESNIRVSYPDLRSGRMLTVCGSLNAVSLAQIAHAAGRGFSLVRMTPEEKLSTADGGQRLLSEKANEIGHLLDAGRDVMLAASLGMEDIASCELLAERKGISSQDLAGIITGSMAKIVQTVLQRQAQVLLVVFGGDTAAGIMNQMNVKTLEPCREIQPGIVLSKFGSGSRMAWLVTKAGGFGEPDILETIRESILKQ